jgi:hypothetical protein
MGCFPFLSSQAELKIISTIQTQIDGMNLWGVESINPVAGLIMILNKMKIWHEKSQ